MKMRRAKWLGLTAVTLVWLGCSDLPSGDPTAPQFQPQFSAVDREDIQRALQAQERHTAALLRIPGIVGTAVGVLPTGKAVVRVYLSRTNVPDLPQALDGVPVATQVTGMFIALSDPTQRQRPAPLGFSVGHPSITAGTIGARVKNTSGQVFILSNNHVLANSNGATAGDPALQPGPFDGGTVNNDQVGTLFAFQPINFSGGSNTIDAAIASTTTNDVGNATPLDDGYGAPSAALFGDADSDGVFDDKSALLGLAVQKYGRTTKRTVGQITGINATLTICYEVLIIFCIKPATFVDQVVIEPGGFSSGGDSGSLIVTNPGLQPVALLFAGSTAQTIGNRIDLVLNHFGVRIDDGVSQPPTPVTDVAVTDVSAPASATQGDAVNVVVTVRNVGNQPVASAFDVSLSDQTDAVAIGTQSVTGLAAGASATRTFSWNTTGRTPGSHTLQATQSFADDNSANDARTTTVLVNAPGTGGGIHVGDLDGTASNDGRSWSAIVEVAVHDASHQVVNGATVVGTWTPSGLASTECTTGELGGNGTCIFLFPGITKKTGSVTFTVSSVTMAGQTYQSSSNHDVDGSSNGTTVRVIKP
jgi:hypothetical protein